MQEVRPKIGNLVKRPTLRVISNELGSAEEPVRLSASEREYFQQLHTLIDQVFTHAAQEYNFTWAELAREAGLNYDTVAKLGNRLTKWPRYATVFKLARAVGWSLSLVQSGKSTSVSMRKTA